MTLPTLYPCCLISVSFDLAGITHYMPSKVPARIRHSIRFRIQVRPLLCFPITIAGAAAPLDLRGAIELVSNTYPGRVVAAQADTTGGEGLHFHVDTLLPHDPGRYTRDCKLGKTLALSGTTSACQGV